MDSEPILKPRIIGKRFDGGTTPLDIRTRIEELKKLQSGWMEGSGTAPTLAGMDWLADAFDAYYTSNVQLPYLFPTIEGHILAEWSLKPWSPSLEINLTTRFAEWHVLNLDTDEESSQTLNMNEQDSWVWLANQIRTFGGEAE